MVTAAEGKWQSKQSGKSEMEQKTFNKFFFSYSEQLTIIIIKKSINLLIILWRIEHRVF